MMDMHSFVVPRKVYICLITLELASIEIKYQGSNTNPFQEGRASVLLFLIAMFCHALALTTNISWPSPTAVIFHVSGVIACETLLWILVSRQWWCIIINVLLLLVATLCYYCKDILQLLNNRLATCFPCMLVPKPCGTVEQKGLNADDQMPNSEEQDGQMQDLEAQEGVDAQIPDLEPVNTM